MAVQVVTGDCRQVLAGLDPGSVQTCVTSPPYFGLRDYGVAGQIGLEATVEEYVAELVAVFREVRRVLADEGTLWLNLGDSYAGTGKSGGGAQGERWDVYGMDTTGPHGGKWMPPPPGLKHKDLIGIPWRVAFALQADGWWLRSDIIWHKPNPMPESVTDRPTKAHEYIFLLTKRDRYFYDADAIAEPATCDRLRGPAHHPDTVSTNGNGGLARRDSNGVRNARTVWTVTTKPFSGAHFATFPPDLIEPCIKAGSRPGDTVLDPFGGAGTTGLVADRLSRHATLIELNPEYAEMARRRIHGDAPLFAEVG